MVRKGIVYGAVVVYLAVVLGCVLRSAPNDPTSNESIPTTVRLAPLTGLPYRGVAMQIQRVDWIPEYKKVMDDVVELGADTLLLIVDGRQENGVSAKIYLDMRMTPTPEGLIDLIKHAKDKKLRVILMPIVLLDNPRGNEWRGTIQPAADGGGWKSWFESYRDMMDQYAWIAQATGVDVMVVGSELVSSEEHADEWHTTIQRIRANYKGRLTYSSNWDHYENIPFWEELDMIGMNSYWKLGKDHNVKVDEVVKNWKEIQNGHPGKHDGLFEFANKKGKPILLLEAGWCSIANAAHEPWDYTKTGEPLDLDLQKRLWEGFFQAWQGESHMAGFMVWAWAPNDGGPEDKGYTVKGKPAYEVVKKWMRKPWTEK